MQVDLFSGHKMVDVVSYSKFVIVTVIIELVDAFFIYIVSAFCSTLCFLAALLSTLFKLPSVINSNF